MPPVTALLALSGATTPDNSPFPKASGLGLLKPEESNIQRYVTRRALDGLFLMIAAEEKKIRQDPMGSGSAILKKVFGRG